MLLVVVVPVASVGLVAPVVVLVVVLLGAAGAGEVMVEVGGVGLVVDDVPTGARVPVEDVPVELLTFDGLGAFVRVVPVECFECARCLAGRGAT